MTAFKTQTEHSFTNTGSAAAHNLVFEWLERCVLSHENCIQTVSGETVVEDIGPELPKRVIDVLPPLGHKYVCLFEAHGSHGHYTSLSHCWGSPDLRPLTTTISTSQDRLHGIEIRTLPKSFQDAISVTRATGIRYLWIDSLCIVQDDQDDWLEQSQQMGTFYERSRFTIAVADALNSHHGLFRTPSRKAVPIPYHDKSGKPRGSIFVMEPEEPSRLEGSTIDK